MAAKTQAENSRAWRERNPEKARENYRAWYHRNPEKAAENSRAYRAKNGARVAAKNRARYEANREYLNEYSSNYRKKVHATFVLTEKLARGACIDCGLTVTEDNHVAFDFDHRDPSAKRSGVSRTSTRYLADEMAKCDLRCANCHRIKTWRQKEGGPPRSVVVLPLDTLF